VTTPDTLRRALRLGAVAVPAASVLLATPAVAAPPTTWPSAEPVPLLQALLIFAGIPLAISAVIALLVMAPSLVRGDRQQRGVSSWTEPQWFGGPGNAVPAGRTPVRGEIGPEGTEGARDDATAAPERAEEPGGASARW
jgi:hypothetical protein